MNIQILYKQSVSELRRAGIETPELDAGIIIGYVLNKDRSFVVSHPEAKLIYSQFVSISKLIKKRKIGVPIAYITGHKEFFGYDFLVTPDVLIPRPETEKLVELAFQRILNIESRIKNNPKIQNLPCRQAGSKFKILDMGTGSGAIVISLMLELFKQFNNETCLAGRQAFGQFNFYASDISKRALTVAKKNAKRLLSPPFEGGVRGGLLNDTIRFIHSDLFQNRLLHRKFDIIIANLPYVPAADLQLITYNLQLGSEPQSAIFADDNGSAIIKRFLKEAPNRLTPSGAILIELDPRNAVEIRDLATALFPAASIELKKDLAGMDRYLIIQH